MVPNSLALIGTIVYSVIKYQSPTCPKWLTYYTITEILKSTPLCFFHWADVNIAQGERLTFFGRLWLKWPTSSAWAVSWWSFSGFSSLCCPHTPFWRSHATFWPVAMGSIMVFKISTRFMVSIRKTNTRVTGANKTLFNTALLHRLISQWMLFIKQEISYLWFWSARVGTMFEWCT